MESSEFSLTIPLDSSEVRQIQVSPGQYRVELDSNLSTWPEEFLIFDKGVDLQCFSGPSVQVQLNHHGLPVNKASVWGSQLLEGPWEELGNTDAAGQLHRKTKAGFRYLLFHKPKELLFLARSPNGFASTDIPQLLIADGQMPFNIKALSSDTGPRIPNAEVSIGGLVLGSTDSEGHLAMSSKGKAWRAIRVNADGFRSQEPLVPSDGAFLANLRPLRNHTLQLLSAQNGEPVHGARVMLFSQNQDAKPTLVWECNSGRNGMFDLPISFTPGTRLIAWHPTGLWVSLELAVALEGEQIEMDPTPSIVIIPGNSAEGSQTIKSCSTRSFWGHSVPVRILANGSIEIPGALGVKRIEVEYASGVTYVLDRAEGLERKISFLEGDLVSRLTGNLNISLRESGSLTGVVKLQSNSLPPSDILQVKYSNFDLGWNNMEQWPDFNGSRPAELPGWKWRDLSVGATALVDADGRFQFHGLPLGRGSLTLQNLSRGGIDVSLSEEAWVNLPTTAEVSLQLLESIPLDFHVVAADNGPGPNRIQLECAKGNDFDSIGNTNFKFFSNHVQCEVPVDQIQTMQIIAPGFYPGKVHLSEPSQSSSLREIRLERLAPMQIIVEDLRENKTALSLRFSHGRYIEEEGIFTPFASEQFEVDSASPSIDFYGAFPDCDVWIRVISSSPAAISIPRFFFEPGGLLTIQVLD